MCDVVDRTASGGGYAGSGAVEGARELRWPGFCACLAAIRRPELYRNFAIHLFVMAPAVVVMCLIARTVDRALELERLVQP